MLYPKILSISGLIALTFAASAQEFSGPEFKIESYNYSVAVQSHPSPGLQTFKPGEEVALTFAAKTKGVPSGFDLYVAIVPTYSTYSILENYDSSVFTSKSMLRTMNMQTGALQYKEGAVLRGDAGQTLIEFNYLEASGSQVLIGGKLASGDLGRFNIAPSNFPVHINIPMDFVVMFFEQSLKQNMSAKALQEMKEKGKKFSHLLTLAFVGSFGNGGEAQISDRAVKFRLPDLPVYYDGFVILPYLVKRRSDESAILIYDDSKAKPIRYTVAGDKSKEHTIPSLKPAAKKETRIDESVHGRLTVASFSPRELTLGEKNSLQVEISYEGLKPNSQIYVVLNTMADNQLVSMLDGFIAKRVFSSIKFVMCNENLEAKASVLQIDPQNKPIFANAPFLGAMEAAYIGEAVEGGQGKMSAVVTFQPPVYNTFYNSVRVTPIALNWDEDGNLCAWFDSDKMNFSTIRIAGK